jgi:tetratricopeptide (TPR) repeat protein
MAATRLEAELVERVREAQGRDWTAAAEAAAELRRSFAGLRVGYEVGAAALRALRRFDEATAVLAEAESHFSGQAWLLIAQASVAQAAGNNVEAQRLALEARRRFPDNGAAYRIALSAARSLQRFDEASAIAAEAVARFPHEAWPLDEQAWNAYACGNWKEAGLLAAELRNRFPEHGGGYHIGSKAARSLRLFDEAASIIEAAAARFSDLPWLAVERASIASARGDFDEALRIAGELRGKFPAEEVGYRLGLSCLRMQNRLGEAQALLRDAQPQFSKLPWFVRSSIELPKLTENRAKAARAIEALRGEGWEKTGVEATGAGTRVVVILGMHRAGTSLCAKIVGRSRYSLGRPLMQAGSDNPDGYYEHAEINRLQEALLTQLGATWDTSWSVREALDANSLDAEANAIVGRLKALVAQQLRDSGGRWAFKDPRTGWLLPIWLRLFDELDITPTWLLAVRDPRAVAASLHARNRLPSELGELLWVEHYLNALRHLGPQIAAVVHYESWFSSPREQIEAVARALDVAATEVTESVETSVIGDLRHNKPDSREPILGVTSEVYGWLRAQTLDLRRLQREAKAAWRALETIGRADPDRSPHRDARRL